MAWPSTIGIGFLASERLISDGSTQYSMMKAFGTLARKCRDAATLMSVVKLWLITGRPRCSAERGDLHRLGEAAAGQVDLDDVDPA